MYVQIKNTKDIHANIIRSVLVEGILYFYI